MYGDAGMRGSHGEGRRREGKKELWKGIKREIVKIKGLFEG